MATTNTPLLLSKYEVGGQTLSNRIALAPMTRGRCDPDKVSVPNDLMREYYTQRASAGIVITEASAISVEGHGWANAGGIWNDDQVAGWKNVTESVHAAGGIIYLQLWHMGRQSHSSYHPDTNDIVSASAIKVPTGNAKNASHENVEWETPRALTVEQIRTTVQDYVAATRRAAAAGFDGVEVHGANGYLIDQFLQKSSNQRTDEYGGSMENRARFLVEVLDAIVADGAMPANRVALRLSPNGNYGGMGADDNDKLFPYVAERISQYGLAYLHVMDGLGFGYHEKCPPVTAMMMKQAFQGPIMANVGLTQEIAEGLLRSGAVDLVAFGRPYISTPDLPERFQNGWPLAADAPYEHWWQPNFGAKGYTDYPCYKADESEKEEKEELPN